MAVFAIIGRDHPGALRDAIITQYGANHFEFAENAWFIPDNGTTKDVADKLGISNGRITAQAIVMRFDGYSGWAPADSWKWLANQGAALPNG
jgi:hypothetical protein